VSTGSGPGLATPSPIWRPVPPSREDLEQALASELKLPPVMGRLLLARGVGSADEARRHLRPLLDRLSDPSVYVDLDRAVVRIQAALRSGETIFVHGDFDADGLCSTALLTRWLRRLGGQIVAFVPHRTEHGYDFGSAGLARAQAAKAGLVITVDCGIVAHDTIAAARAAGLDVIVTDHHTPGPTLPDALAVVNPNRADCPSPGTYLCGAGVAYTVLRRLLTAEGHDNEALLADLDLVALATIADVVPLVGDNRVLVRYGLRALEATTKPGLRALLRASRVTGRPDASDVGFRLAPRINAIGRLGDPERALALLLTEDAAEAEALVRYADELNEQRRAEDRRTVDEAAEMVATLDPATTWGLVLAGQGWHPGVLGIAAGRLRERLHRPAILLTYDGDVVRGSGRSIPEFDLHAALRRCSRWLTRFGGHRQAAGLELPAADLPAFAEAFNAEAEAELASLPLRPELQPDATIAPNEITPETVKLLAYFGPHGAGNPPPLWLGRDLEVRGEIREVGQGHLKLQLGQNGVAHAAIGFGLARRFRPADLQGQRIDALFEVGFNEWRGRTDVQLTVRDLRPAGQGAP
jgi:single-stranded-DNA-specific exonuclease